MNPRFSIQASVCLLVLFVARPALAQESPKALTDQAFLELLEFLGEFTAVDGAWVDPADLLPDEKAQTNVEANTETRARSTVESEGQSATSPPLAAVPAGQPQPDAGTDAEP